LQKVHEFGEGSSPHYIEDNKKLMRICLLRQKLASILGVKIASIEKIFKFLIRLSKLNINPIRAKEFG